MMVNLSATMQADYWRADSGQTAAQRWAVHPLKFLYLSGPINLDNYSATTGGWLAWLSPTDLAEFDIIDSTSSGASPEDRYAAKFIHELRRLSGLTWDQIAKIFGVSRRSIHLWASGKPMTIANEAKLHRLIAFVRRTDRGEAPRNRSALLSVDANGISVLELLLQGKYPEAEAIVGRGMRRAEPPTLIPLSNEARSARRPKHPAELIDASQDVIHKRGGRLMRDLSHPLKRPK